MTRLQITERRPDFREVSGLESASEPLSPPGVTGIRKQPPSSGTVALRDRGTVAKMDAQERAEVIIAESLRYSELIFRRHVAWPDRESLDLVLLWVIHANARNRDETGTGPLIWRASPRLMLTSEERGSGKSTTLDLIAILTGSRYGRLPKITAPAFAKLMGHYQEPAIIDEARMVFGTGTRSQDLQGMMLAGYTPRTAALTAKGGGDGDSLFGPVAFAAKDNLITHAGDSVLDLLDRSLIVRLRPAEQHYPDVDELAEHALELACRGFGTWTSMKRAELTAAALRLSAELAGTDAEDNGDLRTAQIWRPLLAVAEVIGGEWPERAQAAMRASTLPAGIAEDGDWLAEIEELDGLFGGVAAEVPAEPPSRAQLLDDIRAVWPEGYMISADELGARLATLPAWSGHAPDIPALAGVTPVKVTVSGQDMKGYFRYQFARLWAETDGKVTQ